MTTTMAHPKQRSQQRKNDPKKIQQHKELRTRRRPLVLSGVEPGKLQAIQPEHFNLVDVDRRYQRDRITDEINDLILVLQEGGDIPDPITVVKRTFVEAPYKVPSPKYWIIDGQQRFIAHMELGMPIRAMVHNVDSFQAERAFFLVMNTRRQVTANTIVNSWPGYTGELLRKTDASVGHTMSGRVQFVRVGETKIGAAIIVRGLCALLHPGRISGAITNHLNSTDVALRETYARMKADAYLDLLGRVFPTGYAPILAVVALGLVCSEKWASRIETPPNGTASRISRINWRTEVPTNSSRFLPVLTALIKKIWK